METETLDTSSISSSAKTSSWSIIHGSIDDSVKFESSISAANADSDSDASQTSADKRKSPLILRRPSPDSGPCEITIHLAHQHEVMQVYVRSTARVYEIYCSANEKGGSEYLCTVRCGLAAHNDEQVQVTDAVGSMPASCSGDNRFEEEGHSRTESGSSTNEDGWVDVDPSRLDGGDRSESNKKESCSGKGNQDFFEATAEISDADPVKSVTLRLLSIQSGDYVYIDEVYIYADPVLSKYADSSNMPENTSGSTLMSMLVPTLLQLSKSRMSQTQQQNDSAATERRSLDTEPKSNCQAITSGAYRPESMPNSDSCGASVHMPHPEVPVQNTDPQNRPYSMSAEDTLSCSLIEKTLNELVYRIVRIENFCLRFEENMLKPISSMEVRLGKVEQQLESFLKNTDSCRPGCSRISVPECHNSNSSSTWTNGNDCHGCTKSDLEKNDDCCHGETLIPSSEACLSTNSVQESDILDLVKSDDCFYEVVSVPPFEAPSFANGVQESDIPHLVNSDDCCYEVVSVPPLEAPLFANGVQPSEEPVSASASQLHPSLVVTAPDFSSMDDEEEIDAPEAVKDSPKDNCKKALSIDDALASALAGFLSLASTDPFQCTDMVEEDLETSTVERIVNNYPVGVIQDFETSFPSVNINGSDEPESISHEEAALTEMTESVVADNGYEETTKAVGVCHHAEEEDRKECVGISVDSWPDIEKENIEDSGSSVELGSLEDDDATSPALVSSFSDTPAVLNGTQSSDYSAAALELKGGNIDYSSGKEVAKQDPAVLQKLLELPIPATVDFESPILDVKFSSLENSSAKSPLEALLVDMPELQNEILCLREDNENSLSEPTDLVIMEDEGSATCETKNNQLFFFNSYDSCCLSSNTEEERHDDPVLPHDTSDRDMSASLI